MLKNLMKSVLVCFVIASTVMLSAPLADAGVINHGSYAGVAVEYLDVTETSSDPVPLFGAPIILGDTLAFFEPASSNPSLGFSAQSVGGVGDLTDGFLNLVIEALPGNGISNLTFSEGGDYTMSGLGAALAQVSAALNVFELSIVAVDGDLIAPIVLSDTQSVTLNLPSDPSTGPWSLSSSFDLDAALAAVGQSYTLGATKVVAKVDNTLTALSQPGSVAGIFKKDFDIDPKTRNSHNVPEPATMLLAAFGLIAISFSSWTARML